MRTALGQAFGAAIGLAIALATLSAAADPPSAGEKPGAGAFSMDFGAGDGESGGYGAIAVGIAGNDIVGYGSYGMSSRAQAEAAATRGCQRLAEAEGRSAASASCKNELWFVKSCGAIATGDGGGYGTGWGDKPRLACSWALKTCTETGAGGCKAVTYVCSPGGQYGLCELAKP